MLLVPICPQVGYPDPAVLPGAHDAALLLTLALCSFIGQTLLNRSFQISSAAKGSSLMCTQVACRRSCLGLFLVANHGSACASCSLACLACLKAA